MLSVFISPLYLLEDVCEIEKCCMKSLTSIAAEMIALAVSVTIEICMLMFPLHVQSVQETQSDILSSRSASYRASTGECRLSDMDRHTVAGTGAFQESVGDEYLENNCADDPVKLCDFQLLENRIMKTVDSVYQVSFLIKSPQ